LLAVLCPCIKSARIHDLLLPISSSVKKCHTVELV
jgi:hypothetical protein